MHALPDLGQAIRAWRDLIDNAHRLPDVSRLDILAQHLVHLYALGLKLPLSSEPGPPPVGDPPPWPEFWPGLGDLDLATPPLTTLLIGLTADLERGLNLELEPQQNQWWRWAFDERWGTLATVSLLKLHEAIVTHRRTAPPPVEGPEVDEATHIDQPPEAKAAPVVSEEPPEEPVATATPPKATVDASVVSASAAGLLSFEPAPPTRRATGRVIRGASESHRGVLGLRFEPHAEGLGISAVHPAGPAAGQLTAGDVLMAVDGLPLQGRDSSQVQAALSGPAGVARTFTIARGAGLVQVQVTPVSPEELAPAPLAASVLILDSDVTSVLAERAQEAGAQIKSDSEQEGLMHLTGPPTCVASVGELLSVGEAAGWWERIS